MTVDRIEKRELQELFGCVGAVMSEHAEELCDMDAKMGDGDLGLTMRKGFTALPELITATDEEDIGKCLMQAGMKMASVVPSTMGTLMASGVMTGGKKLVGCAFIGPQEFSNYLIGFAEGIMKRGKCAPGDRTVLDAVAPAAQAAWELLDQKPDATLADVCEVALAAADQGVEDTKKMTPKYGKAATFASRAMGVKDQGAYAGYLMMTGYARYIGK